MTDDSSDNQATCPQAENSPPGLLAGVAIVLKEPKIAENIGSAARIALNMGIQRLIVTGEQEYEQERMLKTATHKAAWLIEGMERYSDLKQALSPFARVIGTSARQGRQRGPCPSPRSVIQHSLPFLANNRLALVFGPEDKGLSNEDLLLCHQLCTIPTADFSSLNLAQAVAILSYELYTQAIYYQPKSEQQAPPLPRLATSHELEGMYEHLEQVLERVGFLREEDSGYWMKNIRSFLGRTGLRAKEARIVRGFCRQFLWYDKQRGD